MEGDKKMLSSINYISNLPMRIDAVSVGVSPIHWHTDIQILFVLKGEVDLKISFMTYRLKENDVHIINRTDVHAITGVKNENIVLVLSFNLERYKTRFKDIKERIFISYHADQDKAFQKNQLIRNIFYEVISEMIKKENGFSENIDKLGERCINELYENFQYFSISGDKEFKSHDNDISDRENLERINRIINNIYEHYSEKITLTNLADSEHINKFYLSHLIKRVAGENFQNFVNMVRVENSEHDLLGTDKSIQSIAADSGFSNVKYYIQNFEKWFGVDPKKYRAEFKNCVLGKQEPDQETYDLGYIYHLIESKREKSATEQNICFNEESIVINLDKPAMTRFDFYKGCSISYSNPQLLFFNEVTDAIKPLLSNIRSRDSFATLVQTGPCDNVGAANDPANDTNEGAVQILYGLIKKHKLNRVRNIQIDDRYTGAEGSAFFGFPAIINRDGLIKPAFYAYNFLAELHKTVIQYGTNYILTSDDEHFKMMVFSSEISAIGSKEEICFLFQGHPRAYQIRIQIIDGETISAHRHWVSMCHPSKFDREDIIAMNGSTKPRVCYEVIPAQNAYMKIKLSNPGFALLSFKPI